VIDDTKKVIYCSPVCSGLVHSEHNLCLPHHDDNDSQVPQIIQSQVSSKGEQQHQGKLATMPNVLPNVLLGCTVLLPSNDDGEHLQAILVKKILQHDQNDDGQPVKIQFLVKNVGEAHAEEI